jgi:hypothetical protein
MRNMRQIVLSTWRLGKKGVVLGLLIGLAAIIAGINGGGGATTLLVLIPGYAITTIFFLHSVIRSGGKKLDDWYNIFAFNLSLFCFIAAPFILAAWNYTADIGLLNVLRQVYIGHR